MRAQFLEMLTGGHLPLLRGDFEQWRKGTFSLLQHQARKTQVAE